MPQPAVDNWTNAQYLYHIFLDRADTKINPFAATIQCILESTSNGQPFGSSLAMEGHNLTGMKVGSWKGEVIEKKTWEQKPNGEKYEIVAKFRKFKDLSEFVDSYSGMIDASYPLCSKDNFMGYFSGLYRGRMGAWATDLNYFKKLLQVAWSYSEDFFEDPKTKWKNILVNACDRDLFVMSQHEEIAIKFVKDILK